MSERPRGTVATVETLSGSELLPWAVDARGGFLQGPLELAFLAGRRLELALGDGMVALLVRGGEVAATFLPGRHQLQVAEPGARDAGRPAPARAAAGELPSEGSLLFVSTAGDILLRWPESPASAVPAGECALRITAPVAFFGTFLRQAERVGEEFLRKLLTTLVLDRARALLAAGRTAAQIRPGDLAPLLGPVGLDCRSLRLEPSPAESPSPAPEAVASVVTPSAAPR